MLGFVELPVQRVSLLLYKDRTVRKALSQTVNKQKVDTQKDHALV